MTFPAKKVIKSGFLTQNFKKKTQKHKCLWRARRQKRRFARGVTRKEVQRCMADPVRGPQGMK